MSLLVDICAQEVLEPVVDLGARAELGDPLGDSVSAQVLEVLDRLELVLGPLGATLGSLFSQPAPPRRTALLPLVRLV